MTAKKTTSGNVTTALLQEVLSIAVKKYGHRHYVTAVDIGYKWNGEERTKELCVRIHVKEKKAESVLEAAEMFPTDIKGVQIDVIEGVYKTSESFSQLPPTGRFPVLAGGISVGHPAISAGTLGCLVIDKQNDKPALLSNWHVLVGASGRTGDGILQPGAADGGDTRRDIVANLGRSILDADGDAAIAHLNGTRPWLPILNETHVHLSGIRDSVLDEVLTKSGRTTNVTKARVDGEGVYFIAYQVQPGVFERIGVKGFKLVSIRPNNPGNVELSSGGDSGSVWYNANSGEAVGLHFAGETSNDPRTEHAIACNMTTVTERLNIRLASYLEIATLLSQQHDQDHRAITGFGAPPDGPRESKSISPRGSVEPWRRYAPNGSNPAHRFYFDEYEAQPAQSFEDFEYPGTLEWAGSGTKIISSRYTIWPEFKKALKLYNSRISIPSTHLSEVLVNKYYDAGSYANNLHGIQFKRAVNRPGEFFDHHDVFVDNSERFRADRDFRHILRYLEIRFEQNDYLVEDKLS